MNSIIKPIWSNQKPTSKSQKNSYAIKGVLILFLMLFLATKNYGQQKNFSYFKLVITNEKEDMLLVKHNGIWELPGKKYIDPRSLSEFTSFMAKELGVVQSELRLRGLFTFYYNEAKNPILFNYYSSKYTSGDLKVPPGCTDIAWYSIEDALLIIPFETMRLVLAKMYEEKSYVWGASMRIYKDSPLVLREVILEEDFYPLSK